MFKLLRHFSVMSALATAAIATVLLASFYWVEKRNLRQLAEDRNVAQAYNFANSLMPRYGFYFANASKVPGRVLASMPTTRQLDADLRQLTRGLPVLKVDIFNMDGMSVYSSSPRQIGTRPFDEGDIGQMRPDGNVQSRVTRRDVIDSFGDTFRARHVAETLVPIKDENGDLIVFMKLYTDISAYVGELERGIVTTAAMLIGALSTLYVVLLLVIRRADNILKRQYQELETFNARLEEKVEERTRRLLNHQSVLSWITRSDEFRSGNYEVAIGNLTRVTAATLGAERVSIWSFSADRDALCCHDLHVASTGLHTRGDCLAASEYPTYFGALLSQVHLSIDNAEEDERLKELLADYIKPIGIASVLEVPIVHGSRIEGTLRIEHVGDPIKWTAEHRLFATAIANFASLALERQERLKAEEDLRAANRSVEAANRAKSLFLANMSHEIRTPMNGVFGMTDLLMRTELNERQRKFVGIISGSAKRLLTIINDILDFSRIESGKLDLDRHDFLLRVAIEETIDLLAGEAQRKGLELSVLIGRDVPALVEGDSGRLRQVLTNLISNAIKFTTDGEVSLRIGCEGTSRGRAKVSFEVRDTGIGIPENVQQQLFKPFQQADTSISRRFGGTGLGLSISRHLVELMGGEVELKSKLGEGTSISFEIEMVVKELEAASSSAGYEAEILAGRRVMVLDDRAMNREVIEAYFGDSGAIATAATSAKEAYDELLRASESDSPYDLVVVDMLMPQVNGLEFARIVRANAKLAGTALIMLTSMSWKGDVRVARRMGFGAFLTKPVHRSELLKVAGRLLAQAGCSDDGEAFSRGGKKNDVKLPLGLKVLVAEDNPVNFEVAREYLTGMGCTVAAAENGLQAVDAVARERFDIVLMDCQMPEMDGLTATRIIRAKEAGGDRRHIVIIAVTANAFAEDRTQCLEAGMDDYMSKPFTDHQLRAVLERWAPKLGRGVPAKPLLVKSSDAVDADIVVTAMKVPSSEPLPVQSAAEAEPATVVEAAAVRDDRSATVVAIPQPAKPAEAATEVVPVEMPAKPNRASVTQQSMQNADVLDSSVLRRMQKTHPALVARLLETYLGYAPKAIQDLLAALVAEDGISLKRGAHSLKSSSANIGAMKLSGLCRDLEARLKKSTEWDGAANLTAVADIESAFHAAVSELEKMRSELAAEAAPAAKVIA